MGILIEDKTFLWPSELRARTAWAQKKSLPYHQPGFLATEDSKKAGWRHTRWLSPTKSKCCTGTWLWYFAPSSPRGTPGSWCHTLYWHDVWTPEGSPRPCQQNCKAWGVTVRGWGSVRGQGTSCTWGSICDITYAGGQWWSIWIVSPH